MSIPVVNLDQLVDEKTSENVNVVAANQAVVDAQGHATEAGNKAVEASGYVDDAQQKVLDATAQVALAANEVTNAQDQVVLAANQVGLAGDQVNLAEAQAIIATDKATEASGYAVDAKAAEVQTASYRDDALDYLSAMNVKYDEFDDRWLGALSADPVADNDGHPIQDGALFWNTTTNSLRLWDVDSGAWINPSISQDTLDAIDAINDIIVEVQAVAAIDSEVVTVAGDTTAINEIYNNRTEIYAADDNAAIATTKAGEASVSAGEALASENKAEKWAEEATDVEVELGKYSAKHYAEKADVDKMVWKGEWSAGTYERNDVVRYGTNNYIVIVASTVEEPSVGVEWEVSMEGAAPTYSFTQEGTELVITSTGYVQLPVVDEEW